MNIEQSQENTINTCLTKRNHSQLEFLEELPANPERNYILLTSSKDCNINSYSLKDKSGKCPEQIGQIKDSWVSKMKITPDGEFLFTASGNYLKQWSMKTGNLIRGYERVTNDSVISCMDICPNGNFLLVGYYNGHIEQWSIRMQRLVHDYGMQHHNSLMDLKISPDGKHFFTSGKDGKISHFNLKKKKLMKEYIDYQKGDINCLQITPDSKFLYSASNIDGLKKLDIQKKKLAQTYPELPGGWVNKMAITPNGKFLFTGSFEGVVNRICCQTNLLDKHHGKLHHNWVTSLQVSPDGQNVFSCSWDGNLKQWNGETGEVLKDFSEPHSGEQIDSMTITEIKHKAEMLGDEIEDCCGAFSDSGSTDDGMPDKPIKKLKCQE
jgi:WD40 repeat protein